MILNSFEYGLMNSRWRALIQRHVEARRLLRMGGPMNGGSALEIGCGRGVGMGLALDVFGADTVDRFDLDIRMAALARSELAERGRRIRLWVGDATRIPVPDAAYDAVFDYGIIHHVPRWQDAVTEVARVLRPGGRFYGEEVLAKFVLHPIVRRLFEHPKENRFGATELRTAVENFGLVVHDWTGIWDSFAWFVAIKPDARHERRG